MKNLIKSLTVLKKHGTLLKRMLVIAEIASIEANDETCEIRLTFEKEEDRGRISLHYTYDNSYCYYDVLPQEVTDTDCIRQSEKNPS